MDKLFETIKGEMTYGFGSLTQDDFCTYVLILLGIIAITQIFKTVHFIYLTTKNPNHQSYTEDNFSNLQ